MHHPCRRPQGAALLIASFVLALGLSAMLAVSLLPAMRAAREVVDEQVLAQAREALLAHATGRPIDAIVGPGYLPCPDLDNDGWAESTCGSQNGDSGQAQRLGRLPWKTLGLPDLRDGHGERLWYAVSSKYKGLLNCTVSASCVDMSPEAAVGTITVRDVTGAIVHDGRLADPQAANAGGAVAVVFAPGPPIGRIEDREGSRPRAQVRDCAPGHCNSQGHCLTSPPQLSATCDPVNYLDKAPGAAFGDEDNAGFRDRNDALGRRANADGFIRGPIHLADGALAVNDRLAAITYDAIAPRLMRRIAAEVARCLRQWPAVPAARGRLPWPAPACRQAGPDSPEAWQPVPGVLFGRVPDLPYPDCAMDSGPSPTWWRAWRRHVFYALSSSHRDADRSPAECREGIECLDVLSSGGTRIAAGKAAAVIVAGAPLAQARQSPAGRAAGPVGQWLEEVHRDLERANPNPAAPDCPREPERIACGPDRPCNRLRAASRSPDFNDVVATIP